MTDTTPAAVEVMAQYYSGWARDIRAQGVHSADAEYRDETAQTLRSLSSQLEAENQRHAAAIEAVAKARAEGKAEGLREAMNAVGCLLPEHGAGDPQDSTDRLIDTVRREDYNAILALIPASPPSCDTKTAENVTQDDLCKENAPQDAAQTVQEAAMVLLDGWEDGAVQPGPHLLDAGFTDHQADVASRGMEVALRAIAGGRDD